MGGGGPAAPGRRFPWKPVALFGGAALLLLSAVLGYQRYHQPAGQQQLLWYFREIYPVAHARTLSLQSAMAGLVTEPLPAPELAVHLVDENIVPGIDELAQELRAVRPSEMDTRILHEGYLHALGEMRQDALEVRRIFAAPEGRPDAKRAQAADRIQKVGARFDAFYARAAETWRANGIKPL